MPHGAIRWRAESDKQETDRITPISQAVRTEIDAYLAANPRLGEVPLLPMHEKRPPGAPERSMTRDAAAHMLNKAERLAELPKLRGGLWHAYRRLWATERQDLPDKNVAQAGGLNDTKAMKLSYQHATDDGVLDAVNAK